MPRKIFVKVQWEFPTAGHLVFWKPCPWVKIPKKMLCASTKNSCPKILKPSFENRLGFMPTNIKCLGKVWTICWWITRELINHVTLSVSELEYFWSVETMKILQYAQALQLPLLQAQSSVWNRLSFIKNFLMFLHKFNQIFRVNWTWISDCRATSILKTVPVSQDSKEYV